MQTLSECKKKNSQAENYTRVRRNCVESNGVSLQLYVTSLFGCTKKSLRLSEVK